MNRIFTCRLGSEEILVAELARVYPASSHTVFAPGWIGAEIAPADDRAAAIAFADQCLPSPKPITVASINKGAEAIGTMIIETLRDQEGPWRLHLFSVWPTEQGERRRLGRKRRLESPVFSETSKENRAGPRRLALLCDAVHAYLKKKQRRLLRTQVTDHNALLGSDEWLLQIGLISATSGLFSCYRPSEQPKLRRLVSRFAGGIASVPQDAHAPSAAYRKLQEVLLRTGWSIQPREECVDLGASPGGWTYVALKGGAKVTAVDRSPLTDELMRHPALTFQKGDAFAYEPSHPVDWLLCDVIGFPARTLELLERWISHRWCKRFVVTIKFRGSDEYPILEDFKRLLESRCSDYLFKRLSCNKNEVTAAGQIDQIGSNYSDYSISF